MNIVITGGAGMIGSNLAKNFLDGGHKVTIIDNLWRGSISNLDGLHESNKLCNFIHADLSYPGEWQSCLNDADCVFHLADIVAGIGYVFSNEGFIFRKNLQINATVAMACEIAKVKKYVYVGTACSFPLELQTGVNAEPMKEIDQFPANPESAYGWSKLMGELDAKYMSQNGINTNVLVLHNVYGTPCDYSSNKAQAIPAIAYRAIHFSKGNKILEVWGDGAQGRAFVHVDDVIEALTQTLNTNNNHEPIQIGPSNCTSIKDVAQMLVNIIDPKISIIFNKDKPTGDKGRCADYSKAKKFLGWEPRTNIRDGLCELVDWIKFQEKHKN